MSYILVTEVKDLRWKNIGSYSFIFLLPTAHDPPRRKRIFLYHGFKQINTEVFFTNLQKFMLLSGGGGDDSL